VTSAEGESPFPRPPLQGGLARAAVVAVVLAGLLAVVGIRSSHEGPKSDGRDITLSTPRTMVVRQTEPGGARVYYAPEVSAFDQRGRRLEPSCRPPSGTLFRPGRTIVRCRVVDSHGNVRIESFEVRVIP
jgi:hypothetical protein